MSLYKIIAVLLMISPITIYNSYLYFPYSFLGMTLFFLSSLYSDQNNFLTWDFLFWSFSTLTIISQKPISYQFILHLFILYQYLILYITIKKLYGIIFIGILLSIMSIIIPEGALINMFLLAFVISIEMMKKKEKTYIELSQPLSEEQQNCIIPLESHEQQEQDHVIPLYPEEQN
ncbi:MAG: hypothetical protein ACRC0X_01690 [Brevinema sp.]